MKGYYKIGETFIKGTKYDVYENEIHGSETDWLLINRKTHRKLYKYPLEVILL